MKIRTVPILVLSGLLGGIVATAARPHPQEKAAQLSEFGALGMMRTINTMEVVAFQEPRHQYLSLDATVQLQDSSAGTLKNYRVSVVVSPDRQHYVAQLISSSDCGLAVFSNESLLIYTAKGLDCKDEKSPKKDL